MMGQMGNRIRQAGEQLSGALAGKYAPLIGALGGAAIGAGGSVLGNVVNDQVDKKGPGRIALEALGAGGLAAIPGLAGGRLAKQQQVLNETGVALGPLEKALYTAGQASAPLSSVAYGGLGGLVGGGIANAAGMVGIPGMQSNYVDPEGYGSSNSQMSRPMYKQTTAAAPTRYYS
jgi:hypothetical protein